MRRDIQTKILAWYKEHKRDLPWRKTRDPYKILVSEVMLQQTQVSRVVDKYNQFLKLFSTVQLLANAKTSDVLKAWAGLGYNRRALYLQKTAQAVVTLYKGKFPKDLELLKELPGIGDYTARAILSFAFGESVPVLDTNHRKFYQRTYFGKRVVDDKVLLKKAESVIARSFKATKQSKERHKIASLPATVVRNDRVYDWNQALMDFMTAVSQKSNDPFIIWYQKNYPAYKSKKTSKHENKLIIRFEDSDRYFRGRIIDLLRTEHQTSISILQRRFNQISKERVKKIVAGLLKDGLILIQNKSILLP